MKTKMIALAVILMAAFSDTKAQVYVQGGANFANISTSEAGETQESNMLTTFNAGIMARFGLSEIFDLESGLLVDGRGAKPETYFSSSNDRNFLKARFNPIYLTLPLHAVAKLPLGSDDMNLFIYAGPYASMGIAGKSKVTLNVAGVETSSSKKIEFSNDDPTTVDEQEGARFDRLKKFDFGLDVGAGLDLGAVMVKLNYGHGLTKINSTQTDNNSNDKNKYRTLSVSLGIPLSR